jgi:hypothetical protein
MTLVFENMPEASAVTGAKGRERAVTLMLQKGARRCVLVCGRTSTVHMTIDKHLSILIQGRTSKKAAKVII